jgi:hypothetical protein
MGLKFITTSENGKKLRHISQILKISEDKNTCKPIHKKGIKKKEKKILQTNVKISI